MAKKRAKRSKKRSKRRSRRRSTTHTVKLKRAGAACHAIPGKVRVRDGDRLELVNQTGLLWQVSEPNGVLQLVDATPKSQIYRIVAGGRKGKFPYLVYLHDGGSGAGAIREFAEGNSAPHVII